MKSPLLVGQLAAVSSLVSGALGNAIPARQGLQERAVADIMRRASPQAPNGYVPEAGDCPSERPGIRLATELSPAEQEWLTRRRDNTVTPMKELLGRLNINGFDVNQYFDGISGDATNLPNIGIAASGGGYRALMNGAGVLAAFDSRTPNSTSPGHLGGLLQSATYLSGLSGGGWLVGSLYGNNFTSVQNIIDSTPEVSGSTWQFERSIFQGPERNQSGEIKSTDYFAEIKEAVLAKRTGGFDTSLTDLWGRALSYQLVNASQGGIGFTFSSIADDTDFSQANAPMPILVADKRNPGELLISINTTVIEFNPFEMGTYDPTIYGFAPLKYVGSKFDGGQLGDNEQCVRGFDNLGFVMGTSSSLFNQFLLNLEGADIPDFLRNAAREILQGLSSDNNDIADWTPNPFKGFNRETNPSAGEDRLTLVDGGSDLQNLPLQPLIQPLRAVDVIFAIDTSADTAAPGANWPNGTAMVATYARSVVDDISNGTAFPSVPDTNTFVNLGLNNRPTFFGCDANNNTADEPLIVYLPNAPYVFNSNFSTFDPTTRNVERNAAIQNGYNLATQGNATLDAQWPACVGCAIMSRSWTRTETNVPDICNQCFKRYCWDGTINSATPPPYDPSPKLAELEIESGAVPAFAPLVLALAVAAFSSISLFL